MIDELFAKVPIHKAYFKLALPVVVSMIVTMIYNLADTFFIAKTQNTALIAGVTVCSPLFTFMLAIGDIFGLGGSSAISRLLGQNDHINSRKISSFSLYAALFFSLFITIVMLLFEQPILKLLGATTATYHYAAEFYRILVSGAVFIIVSLVPTNLIRTEGLAVKSMIGSVVGTIITIVLDPLLILGCHWGAAGAATATVIGYIFTDILLLWYTYKDCQVLTLSYRAGKINRHAFKEVLAIGIPASVTNLMQSVEVALLNHYLAAYGTDKIAAMGIMSRIYMIVILIMVGFAFGAQPLIGYNYGAKNVKRFREAVRFDLLVEISYALVVSIILIILAPQMIMLFIDQHNIVVLGAQMLRIFLLTTPFVGIVLVLTTVFQSANQGGSAFAMSISRQGIIFLIALLILAAIYHYIGILWAQPTADVLTFLIGWWLYQRDFKKWEQDNL